jgi:hypothetical protein
LLATASIAAAAALLVAIWLQPERANDPSERQPEIAANVPDAQGGSIRRQFREAGSALVALVGRTANEAVEPTRDLLPQAGPSSSLVPVAWSRPLEPQVRTLRQAGAGVTLGLQPVVSSARRAVAIFLQDDTHDQSDSEGPRQQQ